MKVINVDCNGKIIPDLSKVELPKDLSEALINIVLSSKKKELSK